VPATALKTLELRWRRALLAAGRRPFSGQVAFTAEDLLHLPAAPRILLIRLERIGDVLVSVPVLRSLRDRYPLAHIDLLVSPANRAVGDVVAPFVTRVLCYEKTLRSALALFRSLRRARYDVVVDLVDHPSATSQIVIRWCGARAAVGLLHAESGLYTHAAPVLSRAAVHPVERLAQLLLPFGINPATQSLDLAFPLEAQDIESARLTLGPTHLPLRVGVNLSARDPGKYWGRDNYIGFIRHLTAHDPRFAVSICGARRDAAEVHHIAEATGAQAVPARSSLREFAAILHEFDLLLTPDTAVVHLAAAWKLPTVALYHSDPAVAPWLPYNTPHKAVADPRGIPAIPLERVTAVADDLILERFGAPASADHSDSLRHGER
jgi:ADP-heptose:LPS heptosyltransferase